MANAMYTVWRLAHGLARSECGRETAVRRVCQFAYLTGKAPWDTGVAPPELAGVVDAMPPGRALDLGCGTGTNSIYLARHGWDVIGVDLVERAVRRARTKARAVDVAPTFLRGDVTRLDELPVDPGISLFFDLGCYSGIPAHRRNAYAAGITARSTVDARLLLFGFGPGVLPGPDTAVTADELTARFTGWQLVDATPGTGPISTCWYSLRRV